MHQEGEQHRWSHVKSHWGTIVQTSLMPSNGGIAVLLSIISYLQPFKKNKSNHRKLFSLMGGSWPIPVRAPSCLLQGPREIGQIEKKYSQLHTKYFAARKRIFHSIASASCTGSRGWWFTTLCHMHATTHLHYREKKGRKDQTIHSRRSRDVRKN